MASQGNQEKEDVVVKVEKEAAELAERNLALTRTYFGRDWEVGEEVIYSRNDKAHNECFEYEAVIKSWPKAIPEYEAQAKVNIEYEPGDGTPKRFACVMVRSLRGKIARPSQHLSTIAEPVDVTGADSEEEQRKKKRKMGAEQGSAPPAVDVRHNMPMLAEATKLAFSTLLKAIERGLHAADPETAKQLKQQTKEAKKARDSALQQAAAVAEQLKAARAEAVTAKDNEKEKAGLLAAERKYNEKLSEEIQAVKAKLARAAEEQLETGGTDPAKATAVAATLANKDTEIAALKAELAKVTEQRDKAKLALNSILDK